MTAACARLQVPGDPNRICQRILKSACQCHEIYTGKFRNGNDSSNQNQTQQSDATVAILCRDLANAMDETLFLTCTRCGIELKFCKCSWTFPLDQENPSSSILAQEEEEEENDEERSMSVYILVAKQTR